MGFVCNLAITWTTEALHLHDSLNNVRDGNR